MNCIQCGSELVSESFFCGNCGAPHGRLPAQFVESESRFATLLARHRSGQLDASTYQAELQQLVVQDETGRHWVPGSQEGQWRWHDGGQWVLGEPPLATAVRRCEQCEAELVPERPFCGDCGAAAYRLPASLVEARSRHAALLARYRAGQLDPDNYELERRYLIAQDAVGRQWAPGDIPGEWRWYDGGKWVRRDPPLIPAPVECRRCGSGLLMEDIYCGQCGEPRRTLPPEFTEVQNRYLALQARHESGEIDDQEFHILRQSLVVKDSRGEHWAPDRKQGRWRWFDGQTWVLRDPLAASAHPNEHR